MKHVSRAMAAVITLTLLLAAPARGQVVVKASPTTTKTRAFNPNRPPGDMPKLSGDEAAVTSSRFACTVQVEVTITPGAKTTMTVSGVEAAVGLEIVIWLPNGATRKIKAHEDGHRQLSELSYAKAAETAKKLGEKYIGRTFEVRSSERTDTQPIIQRLANEYTGEYFGAVEVPSEKAQGKYDEITDHGRNNVPEKDAIRKAMGER